MATYIVPTIGSKGYFVLQTPFDALIAPNVEYTCQAIRRISDYVADNRDVKVDIYDANNIAESIYEEDLDNDANIISLQGEMGQWVHVPERYISSYPIVNGVPYRAFGFSIGLPAMPANRDYSNVITGLKNLITQDLGVNCSVEMFEISKVTLVDSDKHNVKQAERGVVAGAPNTDYGRYMDALQKLTAAQQKVAALEAFIAENITPPPTTP